MVNFQTETFGKWILAGEHAVLRGCPALVLPVKNFSMKFSHVDSANLMDVDLVGEKGQELQLIFWGLIETALEKVSKHRTDLTGKLTISSTIPLGAGLGASAALCVGVGQFFAHKGWVQPKDVYEFSRQLEGLFHGESSGVDIAIALEGRGIKFMRGGERAQFVQNWQPKLYLSYSGQRGATSDCVKKVNELRNSSLARAEKIDAQMREAVELAEKAYSLTPQDGFSLLAQSLDLARDCFYQWGLCDGSLDQHIRELSKAGAHAVKPTGSGGGGYVLSLWSTEPPKELQANLIAL
jgi:mevalonate kinase